MRPRPTSLFTQLLNSDTTLSIAIKKNKTLIFLSADSLESFPSVNRTGQVNDTRVRGEQRLKKLHSCGNAFKHAGAARLLSVDGAFSLLATRSFFFCRDRKLANYLSSMYDKIT